MKNHHIIKTIQIKISGDALICENHTIQLANITGIWMGRTPAAGRNLWQNINSLHSKGIHVECCSGTVYSFISSDDDLIGEAYAMLRDRIAKETEFAEAIENAAKDGEIGRPDEKNETIAICAYSGLEVELNRLKEYFEKKKPIDQETLANIQTAIEKNQLADKEGMKPIFREFIQNGTVSVCNELGLFHLIEAIKSIFV